MTCGESYLMRISTKMRRSNPTLLVISLMALIFSLSSRTSQAAIFEGYVQIGTRTFDVSLEIASIEAHGYWISCAVTQGGALISRLGVQITDTGVVAQTETGRLEFPSKLVALWRSQLDSKFLDLLDSSEFLLTTGPDGAVTCESRSPLMLTDALYGKVKLTYRIIPELVVGVRSVADLRQRVNQLELTEIQAYSLGEWLNGFGERVVLSLKRTSGAKGGKPW